MLVTEFCELGDLYHAIRDQEADHLDGQFCWYQRSDNPACHAPEVNALALRQCCTDHL